MRQKEKSMTLEELLREGREMESIKDIQLQNIYDSWCSKVRVALRESMVSESEQKEIVVKMHYMENEYSGYDTRGSIQKALKDTLCFMEERMLLSQRQISKETSLFLIEKILNNFYLYYRAMYKSPLHKKSTLTHEILDKFQIKNEYDLQRMLYSVLLPIFPEARQEVASDNGYGGMRADIYFDEYDLIIETKCTRDSMSEKKLVEELGADGFHYKADVILCETTQKSGL